jgi:chromosome segregation ATPase
LCQALFEEKNHLVAIQQNPAKSLLLLLLISIIMKLFNPSRVLNKRFNATETIIAELRADLLATNERVATLQPRFDTTQTTIGDLRADLLATNERLNASKAINADLRTDLSATNERLNASEATNADLRTDLSVTNESIADLQGQFNDSENGFPALVNCLFDSAIHAN